MKNIIKVIKSLTEEELLEVKNTAENNACPNCTCGNCVFRKIGSGNCTGAIKIILNDGIKSVNSKVLGRGARVILDMYEDYNDFIKF